jgi:hypothetical protein
VLPPWKPWWKDDGTHFDSFKHKSLESISENNIILLGTCDKITVQWKNIQLCAYLGVYTLKSEATFRSYP